MTIRKSSFAPCSASMRSAQAPLCPEKCLQLSHRDGKWHPGQDTQGNHARPWNPKSTSATRIGGNLCVAYHYHDTDTWTTNDNETNSYWRTDKACFYFFFCDLLLCLCDSLFLKFFLNNFLQSKSQKTKVISKERDVFLGKRIISFLPSILFFLKKKT